MVTPPGYTSLLHGPFVKLSMDASEPGTTQDNSSNNNSFVSSQLRDKQTIRNIGETSNKNNSPIQIQNKIVTQDSSDTVKVASSSIKPVCSATNTSVMPPHSDISSASFQSTHTQTAGFQNDTHSSKPAQITIINILPSIPLQLRFAQVATVIISSVVIPKLNMTW